MSISGRITLKAHGDGFVTVIVDMINKPARLLDVVKGRSTQALQSWLNQRDHSFRDRIEVVSMDGCAGYASAAEEAVPKATRVMDPFHVVRLAGDKVTKCRQRLQVETTGRRGRREDPLYKNRKTLLTRDSLLTDGQKARLDDLWAFDEDYQPLYQAYLVYQRVIDAYEMKNRCRAKKAMSNLIDQLRVMKGKAYKEMAQLGRSLHKRRRDILKFFDRGVSNGPVEAINGRLEHLRGIALGFKNLNRYILRCLIHSGGLTNKINAL